MSVAIVWKRVERCAVADTDKVSWCLHEIPCGREMRDVVVLQKCCARGRLPRQVLLMLQLAALTHMFCEYKREGDTRMLVICSSCCKARYGGDTSDVAEVHRWSDSVLTHYKYLCMMHLFRRK
jgi:hypothetical protein